MKTPVLAFAACCLAWNVAPAWSAEFPEFETRVIDPMCGNICYAVTLADVDGDGKQDIVVVDTDRVLWFRNPGKAGYCSVLGITTGLEYSRPISVRANR